MVPVRICALVAALTLFAGACGSSSEASTPATLDDPSTILDTNAFATKLIRDHGIWPETVDARRLFILDQALFETWAVFDGAAPGALLDDGYRELAAGFDPASIDVALAAAAAVVFEKLFDDSVTSLAEVEQFRSDYGVSDVAPGARSPAELGAFIATEVLAAHEMDGSGEEFFYSVTNAGEPAETEVDPTAWQGLNVPTGSATDSTGRPVITEDPASTETQTYDTFHWGEVNTFAVADPTQLYPAAPEPRPQREPGAYLDEVLSIASSPSELDETARAAVSAWTTEHSAVTWNDLARSLIESSSMSGDEAVQALFAMHAAIHDTYVVAWGAKLAYLSPRPITEVRRLATAGETFDSSGEPVAVDDWIPYQDPRSPSPASPSVIAEQVAVAAAAGTVLGEFHDDDLALSREVRAAEAEWAVGPESAMTLIWANYDELIASASKATTDAGIAFAAEVADGRALGERVGPEVYRQAVKLWRAAE